MVTPPSLVSAIGSAVCPLPDPDIQEQEALLNAFLVTAQRFFGGFTSLFESLTDPRHPRYVTYRCQRCSLQVC